MPPSPELRRGASVSDTRVWQLAVLPSAEAYCAATPTDVRALLRHRRIVDYQHGVAATNEPIRLE